MHSIRPMSIVAYKSETKEVFIKYGRVAAPREMLEGTQEKERRKRQRSRINADSTSGDSRSGEPGARCRSGLSRAPP